MVGEGGCSAVPQPQHKLFFVHQHVQHSLARVTVSFLNLLHVFALSQGVDDLL